MLLSLQTTLEPACATKPVMHVVRYRSCRASREAVEAALEGREPAVMHTSRAMAAAGEMYSFCEAMGLNPSAGAQHEGSSWKGPRAVQRPGVSGMPLSRAVSVLSEVPGYARLQFNPQQV